MCTCFVSYLHIVIGFFIYFFWYISNLNQKKRKVHPVDLSDSSEMYVFQICMLPPSVILCYSSEIIEPPVTPSNKRFKKTPPSPGTPEFDLLPPVSLAYVFFFAFSLFDLGSIFKREKLDAAMSTSSSTAGISFGSTE